MLVIVMIVIITVVLLISMDRVSGRQTTNGRSLKAADDRFLNRFLTVGLNAVSDQAIRDKAI